MAKVYVLMGETTSPIAFNVPYPVAVFRTRKEARSELLRREVHGRRHYYIRTADDCTAKDPQ